MGKCFPITHDPRSINDPRGIKRQWVLWSVGVLHYTKVVSGGGRKIYAQTVACVVALWGPKYPPCK